jgi:hypothetical protein
MEVLMHHQSSAPAHDPYPDDHREPPHGCINGVVYVGHLVQDEDGEEVEIFEAAPCRRCGDGSARRS